MHVYSVHTCSMGITVCISVVSYHYIQVDWSTIACIKCFLLTLAVNMDYGTVSVPLFFPSGSTSDPQTQRCFPFATIDDVNVEATENLQLTLSSSNSKAEFLAWLGGSSLYHTHSFH